MGCLVMMGDSVTMSRPMTLRRAFALRLAVTLRSVMMTSRLPMSCCRMATTTRRVPWRGVPETGGSMV
ncbi:unnamed protein product, partial [Mesorhabditis spiculigera]